MRNCAATRWVAAIISIAARMTKLIFGCGYLGERVAQRWRDAGHDVVVVTRRPSARRTLQRKGYQARSSPMSRARIRCDSLPRADTVLFAVGFDRAAGQSIEEVYAGGVRNVLAALPADVRRFIYISTTGVYGSAGGEWVDEATPPDPQREGGRASLAAEQVLAAHPLGRRSIILRLAGIYGPGRVPFIDKLRAGEPIPAPSRWVPQSDSRRRCGQRRGGGRQLANRSTTARAFIA